MEEVIINGVKYIPEYMVLKESLTSEKLKKALAYLFGEAFQKKIKIIIA